MHTSIAGKAFILATSLGLLTSLFASAHAQSVQSGRTTDADGVYRTTTQAGVENPKGQTMQQQIVADGALQMNGQQATEYLSNKTQQWANGGAYYAADGSLSFIWENKQFPDYTWDADQNGLVCIQTPEGFVTSCSLYFDYKNTVWTIVTEVFGERRDFFGGPDTTTNGNNLDDLEPWDPALSGN